MIPEVVHYHHCNVTDVVTLTSSNGALFGSESSTIVGNNSQVDDKFNHLNQDL